MSSVFYRFNHSVQTKDKNGETSLSVKQSIIDGSKGISFQFLKKEKTKFYKIHVVQEDADKFVVTEKKDDKESKKEITKKEFTALIKGKDLSFVADYIKNEQKKVRKEAGHEKMARSKRKSSKKAKKSSKKAKKSSKKKSKKAKKSSKKKSKKAKKSSKKKSKRKSRN